MKRAELLKSYPRVAPKEEGDTVWVKSQIITFPNGKKTLDLDMFYRGELRGRYFFDREEMTYAFYSGEWSTVTLANAARICMDLSASHSFYVYYTGTYRFATEEDLDRAERYLGEPIVSWMWLAESERKKKAQERKKERVRQMMAEVPRIPEDAIEWAKQQVFPGDVLFTQKGEGRTTWQCTACGAKSWRKKGWKQGAKTTCPRCGAPVTVEAKREARIKKEAVVILQAYGNNWIERQMKAVCRWSGGEKAVTFLEERRVIMEKEDCWGRVWSGQLPEADESEQEWWDKNPRNKRFLQSYLYPGGLREVLRYGNLEHSGLAELAEAGVKCYVNGFIATFHERPWLEYLIKAGLTAMAAEIVNAYRWEEGPNSINTRAATLREALMLDGNRTNRLKRINGNLAALEWLQYEQREGVRISQESLAWLSEKKLKVKECKDILDCLGSVNRMVHYFKKQAMPPHRALVVWKDYLAMAMAEGYDVTDDIVRLPKHLRARHNELVEIRNAKEDEERMKKYADLDRKIREQLPKAERYRWEDDTYRIVPAGGCRELMEEGRALHHCVGGSDTYMRKMALGWTWICFLRKKKEPEKPYYTLEIDMEDDNILQWYSSFDRRPNREIISEVLGRFKRDIKSRRQRSRVRVSVAEPA